MKDPAATTWDILQAIRVLERAGYIVYHRSEAHHNVSYHRMEQRGEADFQEEALEAIKRNLRKENLHFESRVMDGKTIKSATLRLK